MQKKSPPVSIYKLAQPKQNDSCEDEIQAINDEDQQFEQEVQIQLDYDELLKNRFLKDKKSNILIRIAPEQPSLKKKPKKIKDKKKKKAIQQIDTKEITDIIIIVLLVLILGVSLFRVVMEVQIQFKKAQQQFQHNKKGFNLISEQQGHKQNVPNDQQNPPPKQPQIIITLTQQCQSHIDKILNQHGNLYDFKLPYEQMNIKSKVNGYMEPKNTFINREKYTEAVTLLRILHNVNQNGTLAISSNPCQNESEKKQILQKTMNQQFERWNSQYQIASYHSKQLPFCLLVNSYNNAKNGLIYRNLDSILQQNYTNYHIVYTDDNSNDQTGAKVLEYLKQKNFPSSKFNVTINPTKNGMMENIYTAIHKGCKEGEIVVMVDGDDSLIGVNVLSLLNAVYQKDKPALLWSNFLCIFNNNKVSMGFSHGYTDKQKTDGSFRKMKGFISSHLKTFFVDVFKRIKTQDLQLNNGKFYGGASDTAMMFSMIEMANPRLKYLPEVLYEYRYDTGQTGNVVNKVPQKEALGKIFATKQYEKLQDFSFIERAIQNAMVIPSVQKPTQIIQVSDEQEDKPPQDLLNQNNQ